MSHEDQQNLIDAQIKARRSVISKAQAEIQAIGDSQ